MTETSVSAHAWWLASRASGLVALALVTFSAAMALAVASRIVRKPALSAIHQQTAVVAVVAIAVHGITLLGDPWLNVGPTQIALPFTLPYRPLWTGLGVIAGYLAAIFGLSFFVRRRIGPRLWRRAHRLTIVVYVLAVAHTVGAGTDAHTPWLRWWLVLTAPLVAVLFVLRVGSSLRRHRPLSPRIPAPAGADPADAPRALVTTSPDERRPPPASGDGHQPRP
jgi:methionine sulfoxide reductase heme-binding subunit